MLHKIVRSLLCFALSCLLVVVASKNNYARETPPSKVNVDITALDLSIKNAAYMTNADSSILQLKQLAQKSIDANYCLGAARAFRAAGGRYFDLGNCTDALVYYKKSLPYAEKSGLKDQAARCHNCFGLVYLTQGNYTEASEECFKALDILKTIDSSDYETAISIYTNLANLCECLNQGEKMIYYLTQAEAIIRKWNTAPDMMIRSLAPILISKANNFSDDQMPDSAIKYYMEVLDAIKGLGANKESVRLYYEANAYVNLGALYGKSCDWDKSASYSNKAIAIAQGKYPDVVECGYYNLGQAFRHFKKYKEAEDIFLQGLKISIALDHKQLLANGYGHLADVYRDTRQYEKAFDYTDSMIALKDTLVTAEKVKTIRQVDAKYHIAEKDAQIAKNELLIARQKDKIARKDLWIGLIAASVLLLMVLSVALYRNSRLKQAGIIRSLKQENTISILKGVVHGEENERIRLARELHDGIGGMLSATKMRFMALRHDNEDLVRSPRYLEAMGLLDIMGDEIRKTSHNLMPEVLLKQNLTEALRTYCNNIQVGTGLQINFQSFGDFSNLSNDFKLNIYRIVQELLKNIQQHANATYAVVQLMMLDAYLTVSVEDNGTGFNTDETKDGIGLHNLKTRVLSLDGHYTLKSEPGKGTTVYIELGIPIVRNPMNS